MDKKEVALTSQVPNMDLVDPSAKDRLVKKVNEFGKENRALAIKAEIDIKKLFFAKTFIVLSQKFFNLSEKQLLKIAENKEELKELDLELAKRATLPACWQALSFIFILPYFVDYQFMTRHDENYPTNSASDSYLYFRYLWRYRRSLKKIYGKDYFPFEAIKNELQKK